MPEKILTYDTIAITGHRDYPDRSALFRGLDKMRAREYLFGGARGVDSDALEYIGKTQPGSRRTVVVPNRLIDQPRSSRITTSRWSTKVVELRNVGYDRYQTRNRYLVDKSNHTRVFYDFRGKGGAYNTLQYAKSKGKSFDVWSLKEFNRNDVMKKTPSQFREWFGNMRYNKINLSAIKHIILNFISEVLQISVQEFLSTVGFAGMKTIEGLW